MNSVLTVSAANDLTLTLVIYNYAHVGEGVLKQAENTTSDIFSTRLGCIMSHEIGHILLGQNAHSLVGIMRGTLLEEDWTQAEQGRLGFTRSQSKQIRTWIVRRTR